MTLTVKRSGNTLVIGEQPQLIVDLKEQKNFIYVNDKKIPYKKEVALSEDLLEGKRKVVYESAVKHYYREACRVAEGYLFAEKHLPQMNTTIREVK